MKHIQVLGILLIIFSSAIAQKPSTKLDDLIIKSFEMKKAKVYPPSVDINVYGFNEKKATRLYTTEKGIVYALPLDNMKCLVPFNLSNMPVYKGVQEIIPGTGEKIEPVLMPNVY